MRGRQARSAVCARLESLGYQHVARRAHDDVFRHAETEHQVTLVPYPRWGRRVDILTLESSFPLPAGGRATAFKVDLSSQVHPDGVALAGRWRPEEVVSLVEKHLVPYLQRVRSAGDVLDMLLAGDVRPAGSVAPRVRVQHGYFLMKWWALADRLPAMRALAREVTETDRLAMSKAPWGRTELAEVLWHGRDLPAPPARLPWGPGDQGDARTEGWYSTAGGEPGRAPQEAEVGMVAPGVVLREQGSH